MRALLSLAFAQLGNASTYKITVQSVQMRSATTGQWVTIATPNQEVDIAAVSASQVAGTLLSNVTIPVDTYDNFKMVLSETMNVSGSHNDAGTDWYTKANGTVTLTGDGTVDSTVDWDADVTDNITPVEGANESATIILAEQGEVTFTLNIDPEPGDGDSIIEIYATTNLSTPITFSANSVVAMSFDFDTQGTVMHADVGGNDVMAFFPPNEGTQFQITVDGTTTTITEASMRIDF